MLSELYIIIIYILILKNEMNISCVILERLLNHFWDSSLVHRNDYNTLYIGLLEGINENMDLKVCSNHAFSKYGECSLSGGYCFDLIWMSTIL